VDGRGVVEGARDRRFDDRAAHERAGVHGIERCAHDVDEIGSELCERSGQGSARD
jgi:hypothetical protein